MIPPTYRSLHRRGSRRRLARTAKKRKGFVHGLIHTPAERHGDPDPGDEKTEIGHDGRRLAFDVILRVHGTHEEIGDEAHGKQADHDVKDGVVGLSSRQDLFVRHGETVHELRADDGGERPRGDEAAMNRADLIAAEEIAQVGRDGGEAAAVHGEDDDDGDLKQAPQAGGGEAGDE